MFLEHFPQTIAQYLDAAWQDKIQARAPILGASLRFAEANNFTATFLYDPECVGRSSAHPFRKHVDIFHGEPGEFAEVFAHLGHEILHIAHSMALPKMHAWGGKICEDINRSSKSRSYQLGPEYHLPSPASAVVARVVSEIDCYAFDPLCAAEARAIFTPKRFNWPITPQWMNELTEEVLKKNEWIAGWMGEGFDHIRDVVHKLTLYKAVLNQAPALHWVEISAEELQALTTIFRPKEKEPLSLQAIQNLRDRTFNHPAYRDIMERLESLERNPRGRVWPTLFRGADC